MLMNLSDAFASPGITMKKTIEPEMERFTSALGDYPIEKKEAYELTVLPIKKDRAQVKGSLQMTFTALCDRCLSEVPVEIGLTIDREVSSPVAELSEDDDSRDLMVGYQLDTEALLYDEITVNWPVKILCREDCKGLCPVCGVNRNQKDCGCDTFVPDPRMAAISDLFQSNKEV